MSLVGQGCPDPATLRLESLPFPRSMIPASYWSGHRPNRCRASATRTVDYYFLSEYGGEDVSQAAEWFEYAFGDHSAKRLKE